MPTSAVKLFDICPFDFSAILTGKIHAKRGENVMGKPRLFFVVLLPIDPF
jgi:hypothetical protein